MWALPACRSVALAVERAASAASMLLVAATGAASGMRTTGSATSLAGAFLTKLCRLQS